MARFVGHMKGFGSTRSWRSGSKKSGLVTVIMGQSYGIKITASMIDPRKKDSLDRFVIEFIESDNPYSETIPETKIIAVIEKNILKFPNLNGV